jgi:REP element-mobilizing transposase RayT
LGLGDRLKPVKEFRVYKRNLPHWEHPGNVYFITFKTADGVTLSEMAKDITLASIKFHSDKKYKLYGCIIMDTHVHCVLQPLEQSKDVYYSLAQIMHSIKSYSANRVQKLLDLKGRVWLDENYDRIVRDESEYIEKMEYIMSNPVKAGLVAEPEDYRWLFYDGSS